MQVEGSVTFCDKFTVPFYAVRITGVVSCLAGITGSTIWRRNRLFLIQSRHQHHYLMLFPCIFYSLRNYYQAEQTKVRNACKRLDGLLHKVPR